MPYGFPAGIQPVYGPQYGENNLLDPSDLNLPGLSLQDRYYLAGLIYQMNPNDANARANWEAWHAAMNPPAAATTPAATTTPVTPPPQPLQPPIIPGAPPLPGFDRPGTPGDYLASAALVNQYAQTAYPNIGGVQGTDAAPANYTMPAGFGSDAAAWQPQAYGAPAPTAPARDPRPAGAPTRAQYMAMQGLPKPQAPAGGPPPGWGQSPQVAGFYSSQNPQAYKAWTDYNQQLSDWRTATQRYQPDYRSMLQSYTGQTPPPASL